MKKEYVIDTKWTAFPLHPDIPPEGLVIAEVYKTRGIDPKQSRLRLQQAADDAGLPFGPRDKSYNSRLAQELGKWVEAEGKGDDYRHAVFRAYFADAMNISHIDVLLKLIGDLGLSASRAKDVLEKRQYREFVDSDWERSHALQINAVPTLLINKKMIVGAQPYDVMEWFMMTNHVKRRGD